MPIPHRGGMSPTHLEVLTIIVFLSTFSLSKTHKTWLPAASIYLFISSHLSTRPTLSHNPTNIPESSRLT